MDKESKIQKGSYLPNSQSKLVIIGLEPKYSAIALSFSLKMENLPTSTQVSFLCSPLQTGNGKPLVKDPEHG